MQADSSVHRNAVWEGGFGQTARFGWHFFQMALAMMLGMVAFRVILVSTGFGDLDDRFPEVWGLSMAFAMALPMAAWMRLRGYRWERTAEMSAAMIVPIALLVAVCASGLLPHTVVVSATGALMWVAMGAVMAYRWREHTQHHGAG